MEMNSKGIADKVIQILNQNKRINHVCHHQYHDCVSINFDKMTKLIDERKPLIFVLPAFPAKSPNRNKTYDIFPDLGERLALTFLNQICNEIKAFYPFGAEVVICSDGRVFNDLLQIKDAEVNAYSQQIAEILRNDQLENIHIFSLDDYYKDMSYELMRNELIEEYGEPEERLKLNIKNCLIALQQFNGIHRFIYEDNLHLYQDHSKNKIKIISKKIAYQVIRRSNAWSVLVANVFSHGIRLSIHPQLCGSDKIGIMLLKSDDVWATPWHRVLLVDGEESILIRKNDAEIRGAKPVFINSQFSHYAFS